MAHRESDGFFDDVRESDWMRLKQRQKNNKFCKNKCEEGDKGEVWYQNNFEPSFTCQHEVRIGGMGDGPKWVCDPHRIDKNNCLVYSVGSSNQFQFEEHVYSEISENCEIHTFDPTIGEHPSNKPDYVNFHPWGVAGKTGKTAKRTVEIYQESGGQVIFRNRLFLNKPTNSGKIQEHVLEMADTMFHSKNKQTVSLFFADFNRFLLVR